MRLCPVSKAEDLLCPELSERMARATRSLISSHYCAKRSDEEVALVILDRGPTSKDITLYELYVALRHRQSGAGTAIIRAVATLAQKSGCDRILVRPHVLDIPSSPLDIDGWYRKRGFVSSSLEKGVLELKLPSGS